MIYLNSDNTAWTTQTPKMLWKSLVEDVSEYYYYELNSDSIDQACDKYNIQKISLLRSFCKKVGLQILLKDYNMFDRHRSTFSEEDILNVFPVVKHIHQRASDAYNVFTTGQNKIQQGFLRDGYELINEALNLLNNVYGAMHPEIAACARLLARLNYIMGDFTEALVYQQRAVLMSERVLGTDHPNTITEYAHMALYCFANNQMSNALKLLYRARYLALVCHGESHPEIALFDSNIGLILQAVSEFDLSLKFLLKALELNTKFFGSKSLKVAMSHHLVARTYSCKGEFRSALDNEKQAYSIYKTQLGEEHDRAKESSDYLKHLTQQAVKFQKTMNNILKGEKNIKIPPIHIQTPSTANVLEILNLINGIVHISQKEINKFREEMLRRQQSANVATATSPKCLESKVSKPAITEGKEQENKEIPNSPKEGHNEKEEILNNANKNHSKTELIQEAC